MPHVVIEHFEAFASGASRNDAMQLALTVCEASAIMAVEDIKVRCLPAEAILFGDGRRSFLHVTVSMLTGRSDEQKDALAQALREAFRTQCPDVESISIDIRDMNPACYRKSLA
ncbi:5-carboxymethyl-2-hydroxymuconate Delta-isomerase [Tianweitania sediminis]|uniref:5-carboxymethyl-2-hydroxymuconate isomerase n=1 Tax=Tianweitania sediminis TaxID=1502156 RepID=A0A8J7UJI8_9HYPH|nr:5-carboxymethyl-2-hydroxymuconate isomerase [Tianweitania sediminis]MBP0438704.1 5-carboxymethyl-2-hydroxymuconate isomerase [Tianweitania sediminis]